MFDENIWIYISIISIIHKTKLARFMILIASGYSLLIVLLVKVRGLVLAKLFLLKKLGLILVGFQP